MKRRIALFVLVIAMFMSSMPTFAAVGGANSASGGDLIEGVLSTRAITDSTVMGQKLAAIVVEYGKHVDSTNLTKGAFTIKDMYYDTTFKEATITAIYTNDSPKMREDKTSVKGKYVIIEIDPFDRVGYMVNYYIDPKTGEKEQYWLKPDVDATVRQNIDIVKDKEKETIAKADTTKWMKMTEETTHLKFEDFMTLTMKSQKNVDAEGNPLDILSWYYLPDGYEKSDKKYPIVFVLCGGGLRYWEKVNSLGETINNAGANIAFDQSATAWIKNGFEDAIIVAVNYRGKYAPAGYSAPEDINQVAQYFIDNFKVDAKRLYYSGNSMGSLTGYQAIGQKPELWAAFMACNGLSSPTGNITTPEGLAAYKAEVERAMTPFAKAKVAVIWQLGYDDAGASGPKGQLYYDFMYNYYKDQGMTDQEIDKILRLNIYYKQDYYDNNILNDDGSYNPHAATKLAYTIDKANFMPWILGQSKK